MMYIYYHCTSQYRSTTTSHTRYTTRMNHACFSVERNNQECKFKFTWLCKTMCDSYTGKFRVCATYSQSSWCVSQDQQLAIQILTKWHGAQYLQGNTSECYKCFSKLQTGVWLMCGYTCAYKLYFMKYAYYCSFDIKLMWFLASFWLCLAH